MDLREVLDTFKTYTKTIIIINAIGRLLKQVLSCYEYNLLNLQATNIFFETSATKFGPPPLRFSVWFKIMYSVIQQHCLLSKMVNLNIKYDIVTRNNYYDFLIPVSRNNLFPCINWSGWISFYCPK